jgi:hypothetical protein
MKFTLIALLFLNSVASIAAEEKLTECLGRHNDSSYQIILKRDRLFYAEVNQNWAEGEVPDSDTVALTTKIVNDNDINYLQTGAPKNGLIEVFSITFHGSQGFVSMKTSPAGDKNIKFKTFCKKL